MFYPRSFSRDYPAPNKAGFLGKSSMAKNNDKFNYQVADTAQVLMGKACAIRRKELGYTQQELADKVGCVVHHIGNFEKGKQNIGLRLFIAILGSLDMHIDLLAKDGDKPVGFPEVNIN